MKTKLSTLLLVVSCTLIFGQKSNYKGQLIDSLSGESIPYASIVFGDNLGIVSNDDGYFTIESNILDNEDIDSLTISSLGFQNKTLLLTKDLDTLIYLNPAIYSLGSVYVPTENLEVDEIVERFYEKLNDNHPDIYISSKLFYRQSQITEMDKMHFELKESTIDGFDKKLLDSIESVIPSETAYYFEMAGTREGNFEQGKFKVERAAELYDKEKDLSFDGIAEQLEQLFNKNVKKNSYFKIKSGLFSTKVEADELFYEEDTEDTKVKEQKTDSVPNFNRFISFESSINRLFDNLFYRDDSTLDIMEKKSRYNWSLEGYDQIDNHSVYKITFEPKGSKDFAGSLYIDMEDFAAMRIDFHNVKPLRSFNLLGISYYNDVYNGKVIFKQQETGYFPKYIEVLDGESVGVSRPLKIIEKNKFVKGRRKQNEISIKMDIKVKNISKHELLLLDVYSSTPENFKNLKRNTAFEPVYLKEFDPQFWSEYLIIEPNETIQNFKIEDSE